MATKAIARRRRASNPRRSRARRRAGFTLPVAVVAGFAPLGFGLLSAAKRALAGDTAGAAQEATIRATGYNTDTGMFHWPVFMQSYGPILVGIIVHKLAGKFGVNRALAAANVPFLRI